MFADSLAPSDEVALEATCNTHAIARLLERRVARVVVVEPAEDARDRRGEGQDRQGRRRGAGAAAGRRLPAGGVAAPTTTTHALRRQVARRAHIVRQRTRLKNQVQAILHRNLIPRCPAADLFGHQGPRAGWPSRRCPPTSARPSRRCCVSWTSTARSCGSSTPSSAASRWARRGQAADDDPRRRRDRRAVDRRRGRRLRAASRSPEKLVSYLGLNPRVRQSGGQPAAHGRITKQGRAHARGMLVEAAWAAVKTPGPAARVLSSASARAAACRSPSSRPPASSRCCAGT